MSKDLLTRRIAIEVVTKEDGSWAKGDDWNYSTTNKTVATLDGEYDYAELVPIPWCAEHNERMQYRGLTELPSICLIRATRATLRRCQQEDPIKHWRVE